ncbi:uncharacterized protein PFL1_01037 [Pseudozyma flocculosa PF-1]|uniref:Related to decapping enzyme n=1 Tax=Pseudozyma flocculosa TaxID=84751 RepID=A0A5C3FBG3_9BASI|nr:uncharacterized protein PFL1_01037 [Pseudozyma flocculosa PF-1]EPQ31704.1 hypothetical protein PFL1_01037 [Pseudozyma flocculosa PF-1]SPO40821.1 related to decapping enzyme [Pseudozyma flocculosa]
MPPRPKENVWNYPRPPALQPTSARLRVIWVTPSKQELTIADTTQGYRVLETSHPPTYYFPPSSVRTDLIRPSKARRTMCEWKGTAAYHDLQFSEEQGPVVPARIWSYPEPTPAFSKIKDYLCFYASSKTDPDRLGHWKCMVDDDEVVAQEGDFYGSWITPEIHGGDKGFKGGPAINVASSSSGSRDPMAAYKGLTFAETLEDLSSRFIVNLPADELASIERICFQVEQGHWFYEDFLRPLNPSLPSLGLRRFSSYLLHTSSIAVPLIQRYITGNGGNQDLEAAFDDFMKYKTRVPVCGAILLAQDWNKCLLVKGWKSSAAWGFPKGKINQDEPERDCAIREVLEETGYDCESLLPPDSEDYLDLTMREQRIRLYIVPGVSDQTKFEAQTRKEISKIAWFRLGDLPTWKKSKEPPPGMGGKFYLISPFIGRLKQWIHANKHSHPNRPRSAQPAPGAGDAGVTAPKGVAAAADYDAATSSPAPAAKAASAVPAFPDSSSLFPTFSTGATSQQKPGPLPAPPTSEKLKALLGLGTGASETDAVPVGQPRSQAGLDGLGAKMIEASGDPRGKELLDLLRGPGAVPSVGTSSGGQHLSEQQQQRAASLLAALNAGLGGGGAAARNHQEQQGGATQGLSAGGNRALLDLINSSPLPASPAAPRHAPPQPSESPLPAPRPQKTIQAAKLLSMISPSSSTFLDHHRQPSQTSLGSSHDSPATASNAEHGKGLPGGESSSDSVFAALMGGSAPSGGHQQQQQQQQQPPTASPQAPSGQAQTLLSMLSPGSSAATAQPYHSPQAPHSGAHQAPLPPHYFGAPASPSQHRGGAGQADAVPSNVDLARLLHQSAMRDGSPSTASGPSPNDMLAILSGSLGARPPPLPQAHQQQQQQQQQHQFPPPFYGGMPPAGMMPFPPPPHHHQHPHPHPGPPPPHGWPFGAPGFEGGQR